MQEPILVPGPQLHKSKDQNSNQESNESANQNSNKKDNQTTTQNPTLVQAQNCNQDSTRKKDQDNKKYSNQSCKKNRNHNDHANPRPGNNPSLLDRTIILGPQNEVRKAHQKLAP